MTERPSIRQLEYLVALAETLNFRRAAERCYVSQPALSAQIQKLEQQLGVKLFERDPRRVLPTAIGEELAADARAVLERCDVLVERAVSHVDPLRGDLHLGAIPTVAPYVLPRVLPAVRRAWPEMRVLLREDRTDALVASLERGDLDLLLLALEPVLGDAETLPLFDEAFVLALPKGHALAAKQSVTVEDLAGEEVLLLEDGHCLRDSTLELCRRSGAHEIADVRATSLGTLVQMVAGGIGVTLLPEMAVDVEVRGDDIELRPFAPPVPVRRVGLAWRRSSLRKDGYRRLGELIESSV